MKFIKGLFVMFLCVLAFVGILCLAWLQESYRLNPPTQAERAAHPFLTEFLAGGE